MNYLGRCGSCLGGLHGILGVRNADRVSWEESASLARCDTPALRPRCATSGLKPAVRSRASGLAVIDRVTCLPHCWFSGHGLGIYNVIGAVRWVSRRLSDLKTSIMRSCGPCVRAPASDDRSCTGVGRGLTMEIVLNQVSFPWLVAECGANLGTGGCPDHSGG